ncbi:hypothetical protein [Nitrosomonas sp. Is37]|uniref:hypothetical protein n=1 Tax=Nitrosomonas sp. Is37 TaxID=3080535 RepID=UPI00294B329E|nr:hypothetical protein [Nitrosomonas sp. Is37]
MPCGDTALSRGSLFYSVGRGGVCGDPGARQGAMRLQGRFLQRRATPHSCLERHMMHLIVASPLW